MGWLSAGKAKRTRQERGSDAALHHARKLKARTLSHTHTLPLSHAHMCVATTTRSEEGGVAELVSKGGLEIEAVVAWLNVWGLPTFLESLLPHLLALVTTRKLPPPPPEPLQLGPAAAAHAHSSAGPAVDMVTRKAAAVLVLLLLLCVLLGLLLLLCLCEFWCCSLSFSLSVSVSLKLLLLLLLLCLCVFCATHTHTHTHTHTWHEAGKARVRRAPWAGGERQLHSRSPDRVLSGGAWKRIRQPSP